ncbi:septum formation protein Maf [Prevotella sp. oral taxon 472 str. F0295]|nr:Maf-like protein [Prevotella sp. oral taxon 472]EEX51885.1 septum formation protein Maf [Prevotella sp. oral taxon 472 str. F0295]
MKHRLVLASNSPRRKELLRGLGIDFEVQLIGDIDESYPNDLPANEVPVHISKAKAAAYMDTMTENEVILTADTVVVCDGEILGKPHDAEDARRMLGLLSGKSHEVITGVTLSTLQWQRSFAVTTVVWFKELSADEISFYVDNYRPFDKAGAYGIQEWIGYVGVQRIEGSYFNVMGLPVQRIYEELKGYFDFLHPFEV